jgi:long-chain acyl-CoA synthetase
MSIADFKTLNEMFLQAVAEFSKPDCFLSKRDGRYQGLASEDALHKVAALASVLARRGVQRGDRVAILAENRVAWALADYALLGLGAVPVPIYTTLLEPDIEYILRDSGAKVAVVSSEQQLQKLLSIRDQTDVKKVIVMDPVENADALPMRPIMDRGPTERDPELEAQARQITPDDLATLIYTSGTTGTAKGVQLTHGNLTSNVMNSLHGFDVHPGHISISFLPLSHVTARHADIALLHRGVTLAYCPFFEQLPQTLQEVRPTIFVAVPRVYEKIHNQVQLQAQGSVKRAVCRWALWVGHGQQPKVLAGKTPTSPGWKLADKLLYSKIRSQLGGRVEIYVSGGAPLGKELAAWYANIGIRIHEGYGLTETSPVIAINNPSAHKMGTVGRPLPNVQVKIAEDGEILVRGPSVFRAYWNRPEETRDAFVDGWFKTGDIGNLDEQGFLSVTDRKKDLLKTSGGKFIAPQPVENSLKLNALIGAVVVVGDRRKFASVIIAPYFPVLEDWARANRVVFSSRASLVAHPKVKALYEDIVGEVNRGLARYETLKRILLVPDEFTSSDGTLTPTLKIRRRAIEERYREQIDDLYADAERAA